MIAPEILEKFVDYLRNEKKGGLAQGTIDRYLLNLRHLTVISGRPLFDIKTYPDIADYIRALRAKHKWSKSTAKNAADTYSVFYTWAARFGHIEYENNPMRMGHEFERGEKVQMDFFDWDDPDFKRLIYNPNNSVRDNAIFHTLRSSGIRAGTLCGLNWRNPCDIRLKERFFRCRIIKGGDWKDVSFDEETAEWLNLYLPQLKRHATLDALFQNEDFTLRMTTSTLYKMIARKAEKLGIHAYPQKLRRSLGGEMLNNGAELTDVQHQLCHARIQTTADHYVGMSTKRRRERYNQFVPKMNQDDIETA